MGLIWALLPDEMMPLLVVGAAVALIVGLIRPRTAGSLVGGIALMILLSPVISSVMGLLPSWLVFLLTALLLLSIARAALGLVLGSHGAQTAVGYMASHMLLVALAMPFRLLAWMIRAVVRWLSNRPR